MKDNGLQLAPHKSVAIVLTRKYKYENPLLVLDDHVIPVKPSMRYLGVELDTRLSFTQHVKQSSQRAT